MGRSYRQHRGYRTVAKQYGSDEVDAQVSIESVDQWDNVSHAVYDSTSQYVYDGLLNGTMALDYSPEYPITNEVFRPMAATTPQSNPVSSDTIIHDDIDWTVGGVMGVIDPVYSLGVVSSDAVEDFALDGRQVIIRRGHNPSAAGPVGTSDHNTLLGLAYAQMVNQYFPNEQSQADVIQGV